MTASQVAEKLGISSANGCYLLGRLADRGDVRVVGTTGAATWKRRQVKVYEVTGAQLGQETAA